MDQESRVNQTSLRLVTEHELPPSDTKWVVDKKYPFLHFNRESGRWFVRVRRRGRKELFKSTGYPLNQKMKAKSRAERMIAEWEGTRPTDNHTMLFRNFVDQYLAHVEKTGLRARTKEQARIYLGQLKAEMGHKYLKDINEGYFDEWLTDYKLRTERKTFADYAKYLSKAMRHAARKQLIQRLPEFPNPDPTKVTGRDYTREEIKAILEHCSPRLELQVRLGVQSFMRLREILFLTWDRVDLDRRIIHLGKDDVKTGTKTGVGRDFYFSERLSALFEKQRQAAKLSPYVFPSPKDPNKPTWSNKTSWLKAKRKAGIKGKARFHDLRHTALVWALLGDAEQQKLPKEQRRVADPLKVSNYAGVSIATIQRVYLKGKIKPEHTVEIADWNNLE